MASMNAPMPELILHDGKPSTAEPAEAAEKANEKKNRSARFLGALGVLCGESGSRLRPGDERIAVGAPACAWDHACEPEATEFVPANLRGHTCPGRGRR